MAQRNFNVVMAMAARITIAEVEDGIVPPGELDPDKIHVPGVYVDRLVQIPSDGFLD
jgi:3-oxoacid CoA-transferase subunit A